MSMYEKDYEEERKRRQEEMDRELIKKVRFVVRFFVGVVAALFIAISFFSSFFICKQNEQAVITTFGKYSQTVGNGPHMVIPFVQRKTKVDMKSRQMQIGYSTEESSKKEKSEEESGNTVLIKEDESLMITKDFNMVSVDFYVVWNVTDAQKFLFASEEPERILRNIIQGAIKTIIGQNNVDDIITTERIKIQGDILQEAIEQLENYDIGVGIVNLSLQDATPPTNAIQEAFNAVETAKQNRDTATMNAETQKNKVLSDSKNEADKILRSAEAQKENRIQEAHGEVERFVKLYEGYANSPEVTKKRLLFETLSKVLPGTKIIFTNEDSSVQSLYPIESLTTQLETKNSTSNSTSNIQQ